MTLFRGDADPPKWKSLAGAQQGLLALVALVIVLGLPLLSVPWSDYILGLTSLVALLLVPTGTGIVMIPRRGAETLTKTQLLSLGFFAGTLAITLVFLQWEYWGGGSTAKLVLVVAAITLSGAGYLMHGKHLALSKRDLSRAGLILIAALPGYAIPYAIFYLGFASYPFADLFQFVHPMKGAVEFARFDRINLFTTGSYVPMQQILWGIAAQYLRVDLLALFWCLPLLTYVVGSAVHWSLVSEITGSLAKRLLAVAFLSVLAGADIIATNGGFAGVASLLLLALLLGPSQRVSQSWIATACLFGFVMFAFAILSRIPPYAYLTMTVAIIVAGSLLGRRLPIWRDFAIAAFACAIILAYHRSALPFVLVAIGAALVLKLRVQVELTDRVNRVLLALSVALPLIVLLQSIVILISLQRPLTSETWLWSVSDHLLRLLFGSSMHPSGDAFLGFGPKVALFEAFRLLSFTALAALGLLTAHALIWRINSRDGSWNELVFINRSWFLSWAVLAIILLGLPFIHRLAFLPASLLLIIFSGVVIDVWRRNLPAQVNILLGSLAGCTSLLAAAILFNQARFVSQSAFLAAMQPVLLAFAVVLLCGIALLGMRWRKATLAVGMTLAVATVLLERQTVVLYFMKYHYTHGTSVSHYNEVDLQLASAVMDWPDDTIIVSDPLTMAITRARTGLNAIIGFSNLDTIAGSTRVALQSIFLTEIFESKSAAAVCTDLILMIARGGAAEVHYFIAGRNQADGRDPGGIVLRRLGYWPTARMRWEGDTAGQISPEVAASQKTRRYRMAILVNGRTVRWAQSRAHLSHYLNHAESLPQDLLQRLGGDKSTTVLNERAVVRRIECIGSVG